MENLGRLKQLLDRGNIVTAPGCFDPLSAKIIEDLGFNALYLGGYATGAHLATTEPATTMTEMATVARLITSRCNLPLIVDGNAGFGDPVHTYRMIQEFENTGISAVHIEDQVYPKRMHYHAGIKHTTAKEELVNKIKAAKEARQNNNFMIIARTDSSRDQQKDFEDWQVAIDRVNCYIEAGADMGMLFPKTKEEARVAARSIDAPLVFTLVEHRQPLFTINELQDMGYSMVIYPKTEVFTTIRAIKKAYEELAQKGITGLGIDESDEIRSEVGRLIGLPKYYELEEKTGKK